MSELIAMALGQLENVPEKQFLQQLRENKLLEDVEPLIPYIPQDTVEELKSMKWGEFKKIMLENAPEKSALVEREKAWKSIEKAFKEFQEKL